MLNSTIYWYANLKLFLHVQVSKPSFYLNELVFKWAESGCICAENIIIIVHERFIKKQRVQLNGHRSGWKGVKSSIPQESVLGPFLFTIFIDDRRGGSL